MLVWVTETIRFDSLKTDGFIRVIFLRKIKQALSFKWKLTTMRKHVIIQSSATKDWKYIATVMGLVVYIEDSY